MKKIIHAATLGLFLGFVSSACSGGANHELGGNQSDAVDSVQQAAAGPCKGACVPGCRCLPVEQPPRGCFPRCITSCGDSDGCGGVCTSGTCPPGGVCGGAGIPGSCAQPDLNPSIVGTVQPLGTFGHKGIFDVTLRNLGSVDVSNAWVLFQTNLSATLTSPLPAVPGFSCIELSGNAPQLGLKCVFTAVPKNGTVAVQLNLSLSTSGVNVLSAIADPDNLIVEQAENNNSANASVTVP